jgi:hypothetical protein
MYQVHIIGNVPYVGFATYRRATVMIRLYFKRLRVMQMFCKKKKKTGRHTHNRIDEVFWRQVSQM